MAGPLWGLAAAAASYGVYAATGSPIWAAIAQSGAWINLFNLIPIWQLDGGRGFRSLTRNQRILATATVGAALLFSGEGMATVALALILLGAAYRSIVREPVDKPDVEGLLQYIVLIGALTGLTLVPIPGFDPASP